MKKKLILAAALAMLFSVNTFAAAAADKEANTTNNVINNTIANFLPNLQKADSPAYYIYLNEDGTYSVITANGRHCVQLNENHHIEGECINEKEINFSGGCGNVIQHKHVCGGCGR